LPPLQKIAILGLSRIVVVDKHRDVNRSRRQTIIISTHREISSETRAAGVCGARGALASQAANSISGNGAIAGRADLMGERERDGNPH